MSRVATANNVQDKPTNGTLVRMLWGLRTFMGTPLARRLVLGLFVLQAVVLVFTMQFGTPPDETNHIQFIDYYANHSLSPVFTNQAPTYHLGDKTREVDYLYHYTMSLVERVLPFSATVEHTIIRLFSVVFGLLTLLILAKVCKRLGLSTTVITTGLLIVTNLPMVLMMSSAVNNDAPVWLGMALGLWLLVRLWQKPTATDLLWLAALAILGGLVKRTMLPLGVVFGVLGLIALIRNFSGIIQGLKRFNWQIAVALILIVIGSGLFIERVGGNLVRYHAVAPSCDQIDGAKACSVFWGDIRDKGLAKRPPARHVSIPEFVVRWSYDSVSNNIDIQTQGWRHEVKPVRWLTPLLFGLLVLGLLYGFMFEKNHFSRDQSSRLRVYVMLVALFFVGVHLAVNYGEYKHYKFYGIALNGRYILPSLLPLSLLAGFYWSKLLAKYPKILIVFALSIVLATVFGSGLMLMLRNPQLYNG